MVLLFASGGHLAAQCGEEGGWGLQHQGTLHCGLQAITLGNRYQVGCVGLGYRTIVLMLLETAVIQNPHGGHSETLVCGAMSVCFWLDGGSISLW